jgi:hypothetical protein
MALVRTSPSQTTQLLLVLGEVLLPVILGGMCVGMVLNDPCRELLLAVPYRFWYLVLERFLILVSGAMLLWGMIIGVGYILQQQLAITWLQFFCGGTAVLVAFAGLGVWAALYLHSAIGGGVLVVGVWSALLLFREELFAHPIGRLVHPFLTLQAPDSSIWILNRLILCSIGLIFLIWALRLTSNEELLLPNEDAREEL